MPNYHYRCNECDVVFQLTLPISTEPSKLFPCSEVCAGQARRVIMSKPQTKGFKVFAGDWFQKQYGYDMGEEAAARAKRKCEIDKAQRELEADGVRIKPTSRQIKGPGAIRKDEL